VRDVHGAFLAAGEPYGDDVAKRVRDAERVSGEERSAAHEWQRMIRTRFADAFSTVDFVVTPTVPVRKKTIGEDLINGRHYRSVLSYFSAVVNHALHPALAAPLADSGHPPASLQVIGPMNSEPGLIALGNILDMAGVTRFIPRPFETN
jgi:Asp-tRNA(Asn)/Glu-tRNA(Gln) amidotransferase A subunit family amidase